MKTIQKNLINYLSNILDSVLNINRDKKRRINTFIDNENTKIYDSVFTLDLINKGKIVNYERGIAQRLRYLAKVYGLGEIIPINRKDRIINVGANIGEVTIWCCLNGADVLSIEGNPFAYECLKSNCYGFNTKLFNEVLWKENSEVTFRNQNGGTSSTIVGIGDLPPGQDNVVQAKTLDTIYEQAFQNNLTSIKAIVGDVEGAEPELLMGSQKLIKKVQYISLDCGPERIGKVSSWDLVAEYLKTNNFKILHHKNSGRRVLIAKNLSYVKKKISAKK